MRDEDCVSSGLGGIFARGYESAQVSCRKCSGGHDLRGDGAERRGGGDRSGGGFTGRARCAAQPPEPCGHPGCGHTDGAGGGRQVQGVDQEDGQRAGEGAAAAWRAGVLARLPGGDGVLSAAGRHRDVLLRPAGLRKFGPAGRSFAVDAGALHGGGRGGSPGAGAGAVRAVWALVGRDPRDGVRAEASAASAGPGDLEYDGGDEVLLEAHGRAEADAAGCEAGAVQMRSRPNRRMTRRSIRRS